MTLNIPDGMPSLAAGRHTPQDGKACVMEMVSVLAGEEWSDAPRCVHPILRTLAIRVNDSIDDSQRHVLVPLIGRFFNTESIYAHQRVSRALRPYTSGEPLDFYVTTSKFVGRIHTCPCSGCRKEAAEGMVAWLSHVLDVVDDALGRAKGHQREVTSEDVDLLREKIHA